MPNSAIDARANPLPRVSVIMPVLNAAPVLGNCLESIARQTYPPDRYEIIIPDGGSKDGSQDIARKYGAIVIDDKASRHMEDSKKVALAQATGEYILFVDADNELTHPDYLERAVKALARNPQALGVEGYYPPSDKMTSFCAYITHLLHISDPLCWLMSAKPVLLGRDGDIERWTLPPNTLSYPLGANGFVYRKADLDSVQANQRFQDTHIAMFLIEAGKREWLRIRGAGVHHYYVDTLWTFLLKRRRAMVHFLNVRQEFGTMWMEKKAPMPQWLACLYCATFVGPTWHAVRGWLKTGDRRWFWHIPASFLSLAGAVWGWFTHRRQAHNKRLVSSLQPRQKLEKTP
jgi:glycosyltransferase involved in cell wall biosynthesis